MISSPQRNFQQATTYALYITSHPQFANPLHNLSSNFLLPHGARQVSTRVTEVIVKTEPSYHSSTHKPAQPTKSPVIAPLF